MRDASHASRITHHSSKYICCLACKAIPTYVNAEQEATACDPDIEAAQAINITTNQLVGWHVAKQFAKQLPVGLVLPW